MKRKRILIYGDSNTYGFDGETGLRFDEETRWTQRCGSILGDGYEIIEEGLCGRTTRHDGIGGDIAAGAFINGMKYIGPCVLSHLPLDMICVKLGSNDLGMAPERTPDMIAKDAAAVLGMAKALSEFKYPEYGCRYALLAPLEATEDALTGSFSDFYDMETVEKSREVTAAFEKRAEKDGFLFFNANEFARCGRADGVHLDAENHAKMADAMAKWIKSIFE